VAANRSENSVDYCWEGPASNGWRVGFSIKGDEWFYVQIKLQVAGLDGIDGPNPDHSSTLFYWPREYCVTNGFDAGTIEFDRDRSLRRNSASEWHVSVLV